MQAICFNSLYSYAYSQYGVPITVYYNKNYCLLSQDLILGVIEWRSTETLMVQLVCTMAPLLPGHMVLSWLTFITQRMCKM